MKAMPDYPEALRCALGDVRPLGETESVGLGEASGRVLAEPVAADRDLPPFDRAQLDGYAVRASEVGRVEAFPVVGTVPAGRPADISVPAGSCIAIATGAPLPADVDAVIPHERSDRENPVRFTIDTLRPGHAVHPRGADARRGDTLVEPGTILGARHLGLAATVGRTSVTAARRPRAMILSSGDEVLPPDAAVAEHQVRNANAPIVWELLVRVGAEPIGHQHLVDERDPTVDALGTAIEHADLVVTVGGISAGERDHFPEALRHHDVALSLRGAAIQPGRPIVVGRAPTGAVVVGLPGNPVSAMACTCLFCWPIVRVLLGLDPALPWRDVTLAETVDPNARRRAFRPAVMAGQDVVRVPRWAGSGDLAHTAATDGLLELPVRREPVDAGATLRFLPWP